MGYGPRGQQELAAHAFDDFEHTKYDVAQRHDGARPEAYVAHRVQPGVMWNTLVVPHGISPKPKQHSIQQV